MMSIDRERPLRFERIPDNLLREPLDYIVADHYRQQRLCDALELLTTEPDSPAAPAMAAAIAGYLSDEFPLHIADEEIDLFPRLRARCLQDDDIGGLLDGLRRDHAADTSLARGIVRDIAKFSSTGSNSEMPYFERVASTFVMTERGHLAMESDVVIPLARRRLLPDDLEQIGRAMAARRRTSFPA